jgi:microcystin-dependent protein
VSDPTHAHGYTDPTHAHVQDTHAALGGPSGGGGVVNDTGLTGANLTGFTATGITINAAGTGISIQVAGTGASVVNAPAGGGGAHNNMPPTMMVNYIIRVL